MAINPVSLILIINALSFKIFTDLRSIQQKGLLMDFAYSHVLHLEYWSGTTST